MTGPLSSGSLPSYKAKHGPLEFSGAAESRYPRGRPSLEEGTLENSPRYLILPR